MFSFHAQIVKKNEEIEDIFNSFPLNLLPETHVVAFKITPFNQVRLPPINSSFPGYDCFFQSIITFEQ